MIIPDTKVTCPACGLHIATTNTVMERDEDDGSIYHDDLDFVSKTAKDYTLACGTNCPSCASNWTDTGGYVHTEHGWEEI